jgi:hypothetical protein
MNKYVIAMTIEDMSSGVTDIHQDTFKGANKYEALGRAFERFSQAGVVHKYQVTLIEKSSRNWPDHLDAYARYLREGKKIQAIKFRREETGEGLKDAKRFIDHLVEKYPDMYIRPNHSEW